MCDFIHRICLCSCVSGVKGVSLPMCPFFGIVIWSGSVLIIVHELCWEFLAEYLK